MIRDVRWRRLCNGKGHLKAVDDPLSYGIIGDGGDDFHLAAAFGTEERVDLINLPDHLGPAAAGDLLFFLLNNDELSILLT